MLEDNVFAFGYVQYKVIAKDPSGNLQSIVGMWGKKLKKDVGKSRHESYILMELLNILKTDEFSQAMFLNCVWCR